MSTGRIEKSNSVAHGSGLDVTVGEADVGWSRGRPPSPGKVIVDRAGVDVLEVACHFLCAEGSDRRGHAIHRSQEADRGAAT
jgi:hypothetical protein